MAVMGGAKQESILDYLSGADVIRNIRANEQIQSQRNLLQIVRDYAAYGVAVSQRFLLHSTALFGLERIAEGKYEQGIIALSVAPFFGALSRAVFPPGEEIKNAKVVVEYLVGVDIPRYIKAEEKIADKIAKRDIPIKVLDYYSYPWIFVGRYLPTALLIDGIRRIFSQQTKWDRYIALTQISYPIYKYARDYIRYRRRLVWIKFIEALSNEWTTVEAILIKHLSRKNSGDKTGT